MAYLNKLLKNMVLLKSNHSIDFNKTNFEKKKIFSKIKLKFVGIFRTVHVTSWFDLGRWWFYSRKIVSRECDRQKQDEKWHKKVELLLLRWCAQLFLICVMPKKSHWTASMTDTRQWNRRWLLSDFCLFDALTSLACIAIHTKWFRPVNWFCCLFLLALLLNLVLKLNKIWIHLMLCPRAHTNRIASHIQWYNTCNKVVFRISRQSAFNYLEGNSQRKMHINQLAYFVQSFANITWCACCTILSIIDEINSRSRFFFFLIPISHTILLSFAVIPSECKIMQWIIDAKRIQVSRYHHLPFFSSGRVIFFLCLLLRPFKQKRRQRQK